MDHHCPWVCNCVGFRNIKFFYLYLFYSTIFILLNISVLIVEGIYFLSLDNSDAAPYIFLVWAGMGCSFLVSVFSLLCYHSWLIGRNLTTIENISMGDASIYNRLYGRAALRKLSYSADSYDLGLRQNWIQVFGPRPLLWFVPVSTT